MGVTLKFALVYLVCSCTFFFVSSKQVSISQGELEGVTVETEEGFHYDAFYAIPFAEPPVGKLRFRAPEQAQGWEGIRDAKTPGPVCYQTYESKDEYYPTGVEDCLYLNVYTPSNISNTSNLPIMFWIHGGGFSTGAANLYNSRYLVEKGVIVVTANYRLSITGFLSLNNADVPGNAGVKDLIMSLKWTKNNIRHFGGDPDNVTIFGESAGGALVHLLLMSSINNELFHKAIIQSGVSVNEWPIQENPDEIIEQLNDLIGVHDVDDLLEIMSDFPVEYLGSIMYSIPKTDGRITPFRPVVEGDYSIDAVIREHPKSIMKNGNFKQIPTINGYTSQEGILFLQHIADTIENAITVDDIITDFEFYLPNDLRNSLNSDEKIIVMDKIKNFYFPHNKDLVEGFIDLNSDHQFIKDTDKSMRILSRYEQQTYCYQFSYHGALNLAQYSMPFEYNYTGAGHADELGYLFGLPEEFSMVQPTTQDTIVLRRMVEMWTNFAKFSNPTPQKSSDVNVIWNPVTENEMNCLNIDSDLSLMEDPLQERMQFWRDLEDRGSHND